MGERYVVIRGGWTSSSVLYQSLPFCWLVWFRWARGTLPAVGSIEFKIGGDALPCSGPLVGEVGAEGFGVFDEGFTASGLHLMGHQ